MPLACTCEICGDPFRVPPSRLKQGPVRFCSRDCMRSAQSQGLLVAHPPGSARRKYLWEPWQLDLLRATWDTRTNALAYLLERLPFPRHAIRSKARALGLGRKLGAKHRPWTEDEMTYLHEHLAMMSLQKLALKLGRTTVAVQIKAKKLHVNKSSDGYTLRQIESLLGMDPHKTQRMIVTGLLRATRKHTERTAAQGGDSYHITDAALKDFIVRSPEHVDLRRVDRDFFIDLLTNGALWTHRFTGIADAIGNG